LEQELDPSWPSNYFNYFTEVEERFRAARGTGLFLLSPLDWALIESWKESGIPLEAVLRGVDEAFAKWRARKRSGQAVNSLAYCAQAVARAAKDLARAGSAGSREPAAPFPLETLREYLVSNAECLSRAGEAYADVAGTLAELARDVETHFADIEGLERRLTALEEKMTAIARASMSEERLIEARRQLDLQLKPHRSKMTVEQLAMLERQFLDRRVIEEAGLRRLSLYFMGA